MFPADPIDLSPIWLSLRLAATTTLILFLIGVPCAWRLVQARSRIRFPLQALLSMPLVLPPSVLGFYLLLAFSPRYWPGHFLHEALHLDLAFTFSGLLVGSLVFSLPFMLNPLISGFDSLPASLSEAAYVLGKSRAETLLKILLPNLKPAILSGLTLTFAHTLGEFGVVLMIGGKIPGHTQVASIAIYDEVEGLHFAAANTYALILFLISFAVLLALYIANRKQTRLFGPR